MPETYFCQDVSASNMSHISDKSGNWLLNYIYLKVIHQIDDCSSFWIRIRYSRAWNMCSKSFQLKHCSVLYDSWYIRHILSVPLLLAWYCIAIGSLLYCTMCTLFIFIRSYSKVGHKMGQGMWFGNVACVVMWFVDVNPKT